MFFIFFCSSAAPSAPVILWSRPYINDIDIQWRWPCSPNGKITAYEVQYWEDGKTDVKKRQFNNQRSTDRISGLKPLTLYRIQLKAATRSGFGDPAMFTLKTGTGVPGITPSHNCFFCYLLARRKIMINDSL